MSMNSKEYWSAGNFVAAIIAPTVFLHREAL